jgi:hypothetical protein
MNRFFARSASAFLFDRSQFGALKSQTEVCATHCKIPSSGRSTTVSPKPLSFFMKIFRVVLCMTAVAMPAMGAPSLLVFPGANPKQNPREIPTVSFCELVKNPASYFDKQVRLSARFQMATEAQYLSDDNCPLSHDQQIGVGAAPLDEKERDIRNAELRKLSEREYGGRAEVTVVGILRNASRHDFAWYQYRFDIVRVENISPVTIPYEGELQATVTYKANVRADSDSGISLVPALKMREHYATRIEWINLSKFPTLGARRPGERRIVFTVLSDELKQMTERRWNRTIRCKILSVE